MSSITTDLQTLSAYEKLIVDNKVANFAYTDKAYSANTSECTSGVATYSELNEQNIPLGNASTLKVNDTILTKGYRAKASPLTRMLVNHFLGRLSFNTNKVNDHIYSLTTSLLNYIGKANGIAQLDSETKVPVTQLHTNESNGILKLDSDGKVSDDLLSSNVVKLNSSGKIPSDLLSGGVNGTATLDANGTLSESQIPAKLLKYMGSWNPQQGEDALTAKLGNFYSVEVYGNGSSTTLNGSSVYFVNNEVVYYDGSQWRKLGANSAMTVNSQLPDSERNISLTGSMIPVYTPTVDTVTMAVGTILTNTPALNSHWGGRNLTGKITMEEAVSYFLKGNLKCVYVGDYWVADGITWRIVEFDPFYNIHGFRPSGESGNYTNRHHIAIMADECIAYTKWDSNNTNGGYSSSNLRVYGMLNVALSKVKSLIGTSHLLEMLMPVSNGASDGVVTGQWNSYDVCRAPSVTELFGSPQGFGENSGNSVVTTNPNTVANGHIGGITHQFSAFRLNPSLVATSSGQHYWTRDVSAGSNVSSGDATKALSIISSYNSSGSFNGVYIEHTSVSNSSVGIRPYFCIG